MSKTTKQGEEKMGEKTRRRLQENLAEMSSHEDSMDALSWELQEGLIITGNEAQHFLDMASQLSEKEKELSRYKSQLDEQGKEIDELRVGLASLREKAKEREWISVKERLPDEMDYYICMMEVEPDLGPRIDVVFYGIRGPGSMAIKKTGWAKPIMHGWANKNVTHWMPFPLPPNS